MTNIKSKKAIGVITMSRITIFNPLSAKYDYKTFH